MIGILVIIWMTFSSLLPEKLEYLRNPLNTNMIIVIGTLTIFLVGVFITKLKNKNLKTADESNPG